VWPLMRQLSQFLFWLLRIWMSFHMGPFNHSMDAIKNNGITKTKLWKSEQNFGSPNETLENCFLKHLLSWLRTTTVLQWLKARVHSITTYPDILIFPSTLFVICTTVFWW
jgi:hypothetical protein